MKIKFNFTIYDPRGRTMTVREGETIPLGWFVSVGGAAPAEVTEVSVVIGTTEDISNPYDGGSEIWVRTLSVRTATQTAAIAAAADADIVGLAEAARLTAIITGAGITGIAVKWQTYYTTDTVGLRIGRDLVTEASIRANLAYWQERQQAAADAAAADAAAAAEAAIWAGMPSVSKMVRAEFLRCGWVAAPQRVFVMGGPDATHLPVDGEMYVFRLEYQSEGYSLRNQSASYSVTTGGTFTEVIIATHPRYDAAIAAARSAWASKTATTPANLLSVIRQSMGDIVTPIAHPLAPPAPTQEENLAAEAAKLAALKAAKDARRQARRDEEAAELAAKKADRLQRGTTAPASSVNSVNLNDPWGSLAGLKL